MLILNNLKEVNQYLEQLGSLHGCLADTGFLYALSYDDDRFFEKANDLHDLLSEKQIAIFTNVVSRMEFVDLIFRKQVTGGVIQLYDELIAKENSKYFYNFVKNIRDLESRGRKINNSFKVGEYHIKKLREEISQHYGDKSWQDFCRQFVGKMLINEWRLLENEFGLNYMEALEGTCHELLNLPLDWVDVVQLMAEQGFRTPDAMIINMFSKSKFELLITSDQDFKKFFSTSDKELNSKAIYIL
jgi:predicted nucleic acid-binding protein